MNLKKNVKLVYVAGPVIFLLIIFFLLIKWSPDKISNVTNNKKQSTNVKYEDLYTKIIELGNTKINLVAKKVTHRAEDGQDWIYGEYQFYASGNDSKLLAKVSSLMPPIYNVEGGDGFFSLRDITNDNISEILIRVEQSASNLTSYEVLKLENGTLVNIKMENLKDNLIAFDSIGEQDGYIYLFWHGSSADYGLGRDYYKLNGNTLTFYKSVFFKFTHENFTKLIGQTCEVFVKDYKDGESKFIEKVPCRADFDFDTYFKGKTRDVSASEHELYSTVDDNLEMSELAATFIREYCNITDPSINSRYNPNHLLLVDLIRSINPVTVDENGNKIYIFPCTDLDAGDVGSLLSYHDGETYKIITIPRIEIKTGKVFYSWDGSMLNYNPETKEFLSSWNKSGGECIQKDYFVLQEQELVAVRSIVNGNCDGKIYNNEDVLKK